MRTLLITLLLVLFASPVAAETTNNDIRELLTRVAHAANNPGNDADLDSAAAALKQALGALERSKKPTEVHTQPAHGRHRGKRGHYRDQERCIEIGFAAYRQAYDDRYALDQAVEKCRGAIDADLLAMSFAAHSKAYDDRYSFRQAVEFAKREDLHGKGGLVRLAFDAHAQAYDDRTALRKAAEWAATVRRRDESCIRRAHGVHAQAYDARYALTRAKETCSQ